MKYINFSFFIALSLIMAACTSEDIGAKPDNPTQPNNSIVCTAEPKLFVEDVASRSTLSFDKSYGMMFSWQTGDKLSIFPASNDESGTTDTKAVYTLKSIFSGNSTKAEFNCEDFELKQNKTYYCFSKDVSQGEGWTISNSQNIKVSYAGQRQLVNYAAADQKYLVDHLGKYDFMVSTAQSETNDNVPFSFKHLGYTLRLVLKDLPNNQKFKKIEIYDNEDAYRQPVRYFDFTKDPDAWQPVDMTKSENKNAERMTLFLGPDTGNDSKDDNDEGISPIDGKIVAYVELPPFDFSKKQLVVNLINANYSEANYYGIYTGKPFLAGNSYNREFNMSEVDKFMVTLKVDYNWYYGNLASRATGDPGNEEKFETPKHLYAFFCVNGLVEDVKDIEDIPSNHWTDPEIDNENFTQLITYCGDNDDKSAKQLIFQPKDKSQLNSARLYVLASDTKFVHGINPLDHRTEADVQKLIYSIPAQRTDESDADYQTRMQKFMRDLYSTPWEDNSNFIGWLKNPSQTVTLYHVAAKVDNQWNNTTTTALSGNFTITGVQSNNLSIFQPTANGTSPFTGTTTTSVSTLITGASAWNGREYFYLPQPSNGKYNIGIGGKSYTDFDFNDPNTITKAGGYTSWLRSQITIK